MSLQRFFYALRVPYPPQAEGFWGPQTSTLNFCEEDYVLSVYCAELCNTITNALFLWLGLKGIHSCIRQSHPPVFLLAYLGYMIVGFGSICFHATLKYPMQLVDELSMIYTTCLMVYASFSFSKSKSFSILLGVGLFALAAFITLYYRATKEPTFHQSAYAALTATVVFRSMWVMESQVRPALKAQGFEQQKLLGNMWAMVITGLTIFLGGYVLWSLDNEFCNELRRARHFIGLPWAIVLEGHAWWHLMTGLAYYYITWGIWLRHCLSKRSEEFDLYWPRLLTSIPEVRRLESREKKNKSS